MCCLLFAHVNSAKVVTDIFENVKGKVKEQLPLKEFVIRAELDPDAYLYISGANNDG